MTDDGADLAAAERIESRRHDRGDVDRSLDADGTLGADRNGRNSGGDAA